MVLVPTLKYVINESWTTWLSERGAGGELSVGSSDDSQHVLTDIQVIIWIHQCSLCSFTVLYFTVRFSPSYYFCILLLTIFISLRRSRLLTYKTFVLFKINIILKSKIEIPVLFHLFKTFTNIVLCKNLLLNFCLLMLSVMSHTLGLLACLLIFLVCVVLCLATAFHYFNFWMFLFWVLLCSVLACFWIFLACS